MSNAPTQEEIEDVVLSARYGEPEEITAFAEKYGWDAVAAARDDRGNTVLHMASANGHLDVIKVILPHATTSLMSAVNEAGSPAVHWAVVNNHMPIVQALAEVPEEQGGGHALLTQKNAAGRDAFTEAIIAGEGKEEIAGWIEAFVWKAEGCPEIAAPEVKDGEIPEEGDEGAEELAAETEKLEVKEGK